MAANAGAIRAGGAYVEIFAKDGAFQQAMTRVQNKLKAVGTAMRQMGTSMSIGGAALGAPFVIAAREAANFTLSMAQVRANTKATEDQFAKLNAAARRMGVEMGQSPTEVASAMNELAKAGLNADGVMGSIGPVLALAAADNMELARAVEVVIGTMSQFGLTTGDFGSIADRLQAAANASVTSVDLIGESLSYVGPQAQAAGQSLDDVLAAMGALAQGGIRGSMAGTQLARVLEAMTSEEAKINKLGVSVRDSTGNLRPFMDVIRDIGAATAGMANADRLQAFMDIFDIRGARAAITLSSLGGEFQRIMGEIQGSAGAATSKAAQVLDSFGGAVRRLGAMFADLKIAVITSMGETATATVRGLGSALQVVTQLIERNPTLTATVAAVAGGMLTLGVAAIAGGIALQTISRGIGLLTAGLRILPALFTPVGLAAVTAFAAVAGGIVIARALSPAFRRETNSIAQALAQLDLTTAWELMNINVAIVLTRLAKRVSDTLGSVRKMFMDAGKYISDTFGAALEAVGLGGGGDFESKLPAAPKKKDSGPTWDDTLKELRNERERIRSRLTPKTETPEPQGAAAAAAVNRGVMPDGPVAADAAGAGGAGGSRSVGTFGSGEGLGIGPELNVLEDSSKQTAENTSQMVQQLANREEIEGKIAALQAKLGGGTLDAMPRKMGDVADATLPDQTKIIEEIAALQAKLATGAAVQQSPVAGALAGVPGAVAGPVVGMPAAGSVAAGTAGPAIERSAGGVRSGMEQLSEMQKLGQEVSQGFKTLIAEAIATKNAVVANGKILQKIAENTDRPGAAFA